MQRHLQYVCSSKVCLWERGELKSTVMCVNCECTPTHTHTHVISWSEHEAPLLAGQCIHLCEGCVWLSARSRGQRSLCLVTSWLGEMQISQLMTPPVWLRKSLLLNYTMAVYHEYKHWLFWKLLKCKRVTGLLYFSYFLKEMWVFDHTKKKKKNVAMWIKGFEWF